MVEASPRWGLVDDTSLCSFWKSGFRSFSNSLLKHSHFQEDICQCPHLPHQFNICQLWPGISRRTVSSFYHLFFSPGNLSLCRWPTHQLVAHGDHRSVLQHRRHQACQHGGTHRGEICLTQADLGGAGVNKCCSFRSSLPRSSTPRSAISLSTRPAR